MGFLKFLRFRMRRKRVAAIADDHASSSGKFNWEEIKNATKNFSKVIGSGGFSTVYLAEFLDSTRGAVKVIHGSRCSERLSRIYKQELEIFLLIRHPNIVNFLGYNFDDGDDDDDDDDDKREGGLLVFDYVPNGNLHEKLPMLTWKCRVLIAFQLAGALDYLHEKSGLHIIHGDIKASNVLLDENLECKLCDFGSAKMGFASTVLPPSTSKMDRMMIMGSQGYMDPHYLKTGLVSKKNDVYSFGVILLELVTGVEASRLTRGDAFKSIVVKANHGFKVEEMVDCSMVKNDGGFDMEEAKATVSIAGMCLGHAPMLRPCMSQILTIMREKIKSVSS